MCITMRVAWLTKDRLRRSRDIRLSTATMGALNSRRPRSTSVRCSIFCFLLLLCILHDARARSVSHDDGDQVHGEISKPVGPTDFGPVGTGGAEGQEAHRRHLMERVYSRNKGDSGEGTRSSEEETLIEEPERIQIETVEDEDSGAKKRRRNDVTLPGKIVLRDAEGFAPREERPKDEGIRRFDAQVEADDTEEIGQRKVPSITPGSFVSEEDQVRFGNANWPNPTKGVNANSSVEEGARQKNDKYNNISVNPHGKPKDIAATTQTEKVGEQETGQIKHITHADLDKARIKKTEDEVRNDLRSLEVGVVNGFGGNERNQEEHDSPSKEEIGVKDLDLNREHRHLAGASSKSKYKSSTVYLSAEEGNLPGRDQESIVNGQIKRLISIRDDALELVGNGTRFSEKLNDKKSVGIENAEETRSQRSNDVENASARTKNLSQSSPTDPDRLLQKWKNQAATLQEQMKNTTFVRYLKEHAVEVLPDIPKFTEIELLETLKGIALSRVSSSSETYAATLNETALSKEQMEIIKCAEQLVETKQRQSFVANVAECVRGLSVLNCMRIFVWPVVLNNMPESISQTLNNLPIEINLIDLFQGNRTNKTARSDSGAHRARLLTPEFVVFNILKNALDTKTVYDHAPIFIDSKNETLRRLLTVGQLQILQMAERLLPGDARREYSDRMFSCVRRFEYFSCIKYFAWPMIKQHYPTLPNFPDYQTWYPSVAFYPQYPIVPFPSFVETTGELPEVVDADATRMRRPKPEAVIVNILQNTLKEHAKAPPPSVSHNTGSYVAVLPPEQLLSIHMAEQLLPKPYRPEFVQRTVKCIQEFNYLTCIKYSTWPTVKQFIPGLPDISGWITNLQFPDVFGSYLPDLPSIPSLSNIPDLSMFIPGLASGGETPIVEQPSQTSDSASSGRFPAILIRQNKIPPRASNELEDDITDILTRVRGSLKVIPGGPSLIISGNVIILTTITEKEMNILKLSESILPSNVRASFVAQVLSCLQSDNDFINCTKYIIWPAVALYVPNLPEFPTSIPDRQPSESERTQVKDKETSHQIMKEQQGWAKSQNAANVKIISRTKFPQSSSPVISVTGTRFVPIFTEHPESVLLNILRSIQLPLSSAQNDQIMKINSSSQQFADLLSDQQENILRTAENLLPDATRPFFVTRMIECLRKDNFLECSRNVLWPTLSEYFPRLPSFPDFGAYSPTAADSKPTQPQTLTDSSPLSETDVKIGQDGDATVTITDTRFFPIFTEHPEAVILNILKAVQHATPSTYLNSITTSRSPEIIAYFTEQQADIVHVAESLLPESVRPVFVERMVACVRQSTFLQCTRDITWPTVAQFFPRLPNFPNFGAQNVPRTKLDLSSILLHNVYSENQRFNEEAGDAWKSAVEVMEDKVESTLKELLSKDSSPRVENSYLDAGNPAVNALLTARETNIVKLTERAIPYILRDAYVTKMLECVRSNSFMTCTQHISWPTLKQYAPTLPSFDQLLSQLPALGQFPDLSGQIPDFSGQIPVFGGVGNFPFAENPAIPQLPPQISAIPGGIQGSIPGLPEFPSFGGIGFPQYAILKSQKEAVRSSLSHTEPTQNQISGISVAANTPSVDNERAPRVSGLLPSTLKTAYKDKIDSLEVEQEQVPVKESVPSQPSKEEHERRRRSVERLSNFYYETDDGEAERASQVIDDSTFPNITESEFLQLLINISKSAKFKETTTDEATRTEYFVDTLNSTLRNSLTIEQREILTIVESLNKHTASRGFLTRVIQCISSLSFIRCMGIFVWPVLTSTVPSLLGLPSLPAIPGIGILGRSTESEVERFFGMSASDFEKELLMRKESDENIFLGWYKKLMEYKFQTNIGFLKINGYGNGEVGISLNSYREDRATKIKDNKNLPSILTIISDIMEEVLDQRPDNEKIKKDKEKRERSLGEMQETDFQLLKEGDEFTEVKRSMNDDQIITMFLDKIKANATDFADGDVTQFLNVEDAYNAFGELFGTRLNDKFASRLKAFTEEHLRSLNRQTPEDRAKISSAEELKLIPLKKEEKVSYDLERESMKNQEMRKREHRVKNEVKSLLDKYTDKFARIVLAQKTESNIESKVRNADSLSDKSARSELRVQLPRLREDILSQKITSTMTHLGRALKMKMSTMLPGIGLVISFLIQTALAHARAAASMAGMISNMAFASAMFSMIRQNLFGSDNPKIKYVYDNDRIGPGITWPEHHEPHHRGK